MTIRLGVIALTLAGLAAVAVLTAWAGIADVAAALADVGWLGLAWVCVLQLGSLALCAAAWQILAGGGGFAPFFTARWIRDGASNLIGILPGVGEAAGARALTLFGAGGGLATASSVVDLAVESLSQALYTTVGLIPLLAAVDADQATAWIGAAAIAAVPILATYLVTRHRGALELAERLLVRAARAFGIADSAAELRLAHNVLNLSARHQRIALSVLIHTAAWGMGAVQVWAAAQAMDRPIGPGEALALESLVYAARGALFVVPAGVGVQEATFVLVGAVLGVDAAGAIALSLVLRARDVLLGAPAVLLWSAVEGRDRWLRRGELRVRARERAGDR